MTKIFGFSPEETSAVLKGKEANGSIQVGDRLKFFEDWLTNLERRMRVIERNLKITYPTEEPK